MSFLQPLTSIYNMFHPRVFAANGTVPPNPATDEVKDTQLAAKLAR